MKYKIDAVISTGDYSNITPAFEVETEEEEEFAVNKIKELTNRFGKVTLIDKRSGGKRIETFTGEVVFFNEDTHSYTDEAGNVLVSGSKYAESVSPKFDLAMMLPKTAKSWEVNETELGELWKLNGEVSTSWGTAIHKALEVYHRFNSIGDTIKQKKEMEDNYALPKNKFLRDIVQSYIQKFGFDAMSEVVVSDVANKMVGTIDRLAVSDGVYRIGDYKTNYDMDDKKILKYQHQLSFYANILINKGFTVGGLDLFYLDEDFNWVHKELDVLQLAS